ncbi:cholesterol oxidase [Mycobacterium sp. 852002-51057_SCH5723018]|nr:cholesterol oxidase [Mycobacterium sp. 852002-51057_SCH5723018]
MREHSAAEEVARVPVTRETHRVIVVGSGFGGGIAALRLTEAGVPVTVLEQGVEWNVSPDRDAFPRPASNPLDKRLLWFDSNPDVFGRPVLGGPYPGVLSAFSGDNVTSIAGVGVGGGSLLYQGMSLQPSRELFETHLPSGLDYDEMDQVYYPRVASMLRLATAPDDVIDSPNYRVSRVFAARVRRAGYAVEKVPMPIDWDCVRAELRGEVRPSLSNGDCVFGVNSAGKHSVDKTYLAAARATDRLTLHTLHQVTGIALAPDGRWQVEVDRLDMQGRKRETKILTTSALVLAAGSVSTTRMLVRAEALGHIPDLPDGVGDNWGTNGDRIYVWTDLADGFGAVQGGPVVYCSKDWDDPQRANTLIQASMPPFGGLDMRSTMLVGYGVSQARGWFSYVGDTDKVKLSFPRKGDAAIWADIHTRAKRIVGRAGILTDTNRIDNSTWHPLGGASAGTVCDLDGRVQGHRGLYVLDGALIPGTTAACNPSMTIAAVVEHALERIVRDDVGSVI